LTSLKPYFTSGRKGISVRIFHVFVRNNWSSL